MTAALSVKTTIPRTGRPSWYRDQGSIIDAETGLLPYDLAHDSARDSNDHLGLTFERRAPIIYFRAVEPAVYEAIWPVWVEQFSVREGRALLAAADTARANVRPLSPLTRNGQRRPNADRRNGHQGDPFPGNNLGSAGRRPASPGTAPGGADAGRRPALPGVRFGGPQFERAAKPCEIKNCRRSADWSRASVTSDMTACPIKSILVSCRIRG